MRTELGGAVRADRAYALRVGDRFFCGFGRRGRLQTAWSLAGAKLFLQKEEAIVERVEQKGRAARWVSVGCS